MADKKVGNAKTKTRVQVLPSDQYFVQQDTKND